MVTIRRRSFESTAGSARPRGNAFGGKDPSFQELHEWLEEGRRIDRRHWHTRAWKSIWRALQAWKILWRIMRSQPNGLPQLKRKISMPPVKPPRLAESASDRRRGIQSTEQLVKEVRRLSRKFDERPLTRARDPVPRIQYRKGGAVSVVLDNKTLAPPPPDPCRFHQLDRKDRWSVTTFRSGPAADNWRDSAMVPGSGIMEDLELVTASGVLFPEVIKAHAHVHMFGGPEDRGRYVRWDETTPWKKYDDLEEVTWNQWDDDEEEDVVSSTGTENRDSKEIEYEYSTRHVGYLGRLDRNPPYQERKARGQKAQEGRYKQRNAAPSGFIRRGPKPPA